MATDAFKELINALSATTVPGFIIQRYRNWNFSDKVGARFEWAGNIAVEIFDEDATEKWAVIIYCPPQFEFVQPSVKDTLKLVFNTVGRIATAYRISVNYQVRYNDTYQLRCVTTAEAAWEWFRMNYPVIPQVLLNMQRGCAIHEWVLVEMSAVEDKTLLYHALLWCAEHRWGVPEPSLWGYHAVLRSFANFPNDFKQLPVP